MVGRMPWSAKRSRAVSDSSAASSTEPGNRPRFPSCASESSAASAMGGNRPRLPSGGENSHSSSTTLMSVGSRKERVSSAEERLMKARKAVDSYLRKIGNVSGKPISMNRDTGMAYFPYQRFIVVIEIPADHPNNLYMYTCVCRFEDTDNVTRIMQTAMELNYMQHRTRGGTLGLERTEVNLCLSTPLVGLSSSSLKLLMDDFLMTSTEVHNVLEQSKKFG